MSADAPQPPLKFTAQRAFTQRLVLATLTGRAVHISHIRSSSTEPGLAPHEISFLRLLEAITNGSVIEISYTGTTVLYRPGLITGSVAGGGASSGVIKHELSDQCSRGISYFLIPLCLLAPFSKAPVNVIFTGAGVITSATSGGDPSVDTVRTAILPLFEQFGISNNIEVRILRRSGPGHNGKGGAGEVQLVFGHQVRLPKTVHILNPGRVKRVRGVAYAIGVSKSNNARMIEAARGILNPLVPDTYVYSEASPAPYAPSTQSSTSTSSSPSKRKTGIGFGLSLVAESSTGSLYSADVASSSSGGQPPEDIGRDCALQLVESISRGGCVASTAVPTILTLMAMGTEDVGRVRLGRDVLASEEMIEYARDLRSFGASGWGIREAEGSSGGDVIVSVVGRGVGNVGRKIA